MIGVITDIIQSLGMIIWAIIVISLAKRMRRYENHLPVVINKWREVSEISDPQPICGCTHHQCFHDDNGCGHQWSSRSDMPLNTCGCKRYTGPEPLPQVIP